MKALNALLSAVGWTAFVFLILFGAAAMPTISAFILFAAALICLPIKPVKKLISKALPYRALRVLVVAVLFVVGMLLFPTDTTPEQPDETENVQTAAEPDDTEEIVPEEPETDVPETKPEEPKPEPEPDTGPPAPETEPEPEPETKSPEEIRAEYISDCETVVYKDVERNPGNYEGKTISVKGKVIQVSEGWFGTVTLRIDTSEGTWYATYKRGSDESRILNGDQITVYGECTGVETYTTVLGAKTTIPALEIEYYELTPLYAVDKNAETYPEGQYKGGADLPAGQYMLIANEAIAAYFALTRDANAQDYIHNDNFDGHSIVEIHDGEYLTLKRCYAVPMETAPTVNSTDGYLSDGFYIVGQHIPAGEYKVEATEDISAYTCIYSDVRRSNIVSNDNFDGTRYVQLADGQCFEIKRGRIYIGE